MSGELTDEEAGEKWRELQAIYLMRDVLLTLGDYLDAKAKREIGKNLTEYEEEHGQLTDEEAEEVRRNGKMPDRAVAQEMNRLFGRAGQ